MVVSLLLRRTLLAGVLCFGLTVAAQPAKRALKLEDLQRMKDVRDPEVTPDGKSIAYVVSQVDVKADKSNSHIWIVEADGSNDRQVTFSQDSESAPKWSPDGKFLSFTSGRPGPAKGSQVWLMARQGGEAYQLTDIKGRLQGYEWSPDSKKLAMIVGDPDPDGEPAAAGAPPKTPKPIVIDRYKFKQDVQGYLLSGRHSYLYLFDIASKKLERVTTQTKWDEAAPSWSPDGTRIAFLSNRNPDPDRDPVSQLFVAEARAGATEKQLAPQAGRGRSGVEWSPDGKLLAFTEPDEKKWGAYNMDHLLVVPADGSSAPRRLKALEAMDRSVNSPRFSGDSQSVDVLMTDDMSVYPVRAKVDGSSAERLMAKPVVINGPSSAGGTTAVLTGGDTKATEVHVLSGGALRQVTHQNDALMAELDLGGTEEVKAISKDGTEVHSLLTYPVGYVKGTKVPLLLRIHGGPNGQDQHQFSAERQYFAAHGYAVLAVNYRGSAGRGQKYSRAIAADWGHYEVDDLIASVNQVIKMGIADPDKLGVGGWSYGGILTDYIIATDTRFKAATSGAGTAFTVSFYGTDQYIIQYDHEIGPPWTAKGWDAYVKLSYPFLHADRIKTPTLFLGGERDFNVPIQGSQQMYQALRSLGIDTQLIIYPNEFHGIGRPSYRKDMMERYLAWYDKYILGKTTPAPKTEPTPASGAQTAGR